MLCAPVVSDPMVDDRVYRLGEGVRLDSPMNDIDGLGSPGIGLEIPVELVQLNFKFRKLLVISQRTSD